MTVQTELNGSAQSLEYIACVEGIGWPQDIHDLTAGWQGTVIASADQLGTLATILTDGAEVFSCAVKGGLTPPSAFSDSIDPVTMEFSLGAADFDVVNPGAWIDDVICPRKDTEQSGAEGTGALQTALTYQSTTVDIIWANPGGTTDPFDVSDVAWVGGREAILLGARAANGGGYRYTDCTRGYLGTPRGSWDPRASWQGQHVFKLATTVYPWCQFWRGRKVAIFAHVPGETRGNCALVFRGRLTNIKRQGNGTVWAFSATADQFLGHRRIRETPQWQCEGTIGRNSFRAFLPFIRAEDATSDGLNDYAMYYAYRYRTVPGGAELPGATEAAPQAEIGSVEFPETGEQAGGTDIYLAQTLIKIDDLFVRLLGKMPFPAAGVAPNYWFYVSTLEAEIAGTEVAVADGDEQRTKLHAKVSFLLDNLLDEIWANRWTVNGTIRRGVVDVALIWMTSCDSEFFRADAAAAGTTTTVNFTAPGWATDQWVGYALHCVEGTNKGEARVITGNDADTITVDTAFSADTHVGNEYQIRNSIYDVLPFGWGLGIHNSDIDIDEWENLRDRYLSGAEIGKFAVGDNPTIDYWELICENLFRPYGIVPYVDRSTAKLTPKFIFSLTVDAAFETVISVSDSDLLPGSFEAVDFIPRQQITRIKLSTRRSTVITVGPLHTWRGSRPSSGDPNDLRAYRLVEYTDPTGDGDGGDTVEIRAGDAEFHFDQNERDTLEINAMLNDSEHLAQLAALWQSRLRDLVKPCYESTIYLHNRLMLQVQAGSILSLTSTAFGVRNPFTNVAGLSSVPARVLSSRISTEVGGESSIECRIQLLDPVSSCRIAPACDITAITDGGGDGWYFTIDPDKYVDEPSASGYAISDFMLIAVDDRLELRDKTGALKEGPLTVAYFGTNKTSDPTAATSARIYVDEVVASAYAAGDYLTFYSWDNSATANMELYSALADSTDEELGAGDTPKEYL